MADWGIYPGEMGAYKWAVCLPLYRYTLGQYRNEVWKLSKHMGTIGIYYSGEKRKNNIWAASLGVIIGLGVIVTI